MNPTESHDEGADTPCGSRWVPWTSPTTGLRIGSTAGSEDDLDRNALVLGVIVVAPPSTPRAHPVSDHGG